MGELGGIASSWTGVHQTSPIGTPAKATGTNNAPTVTVTAASGDMVVDGLYCEPDTITNNASQTLINEIEAIGGYTSIGGSYEAWSSGTTVVMSWSCGSSEAWGIIGVALKPAAAGGGGPVIPVFMHHYLHAMGR
jgi:hypothetical protein